ncbi:MAG TPA: hypothetical protein VL225_18970 [Vicinamibacterales bacterium]|jgi:hypothetical protein|nr:hypothetical protein [Vicinamibacterales bacterium]
MTATRARRWLAFLALALGAAAAAARTPASRASSVVHAAPVYKPASGC